MKWGRLRVKVLAFELPEDAKLKDIAVTVAGQKVAGKAKQEGRRVTVILAEEAVVEAGNTVEVKLIIDPRKSNVVRE